MSKIHYFAGESGGVGKTTVCSTAIAYHRTRGLDCAIFDGDRSKPDVYLAHKNLGCRRAILSEAEHLQNAANGIFEAALEKPVLVNMPAASFVAFAGWIKNSDLLALAEEFKITFYLWFVLDGTPSSNKLLAQSLTYFNGKVPHVAVKNHGRNSNWQLFDQNQELTALLAQYETPIMNFPKFHGNAERQTIADKGLSLLEASQHEAFGIISRQRIKKFIRESSEAFAAVGLFEELPLYP